MNDNARRIRTASQRSSLKAAGSTHVLLLGASIDLRLDEWSQHPARVDGVASDACWQGPAGNQTTDNGVWQATIVPDPAASRATVLVKPMTPCLAATYADLLA